MDNGPSVDAPLYTDNKYLFKSNRKLFFSKKAYSF